MKHLTISLLIAALCFTCFFSCGGNASADGDAQTELTSERKNPENNLSKQEMLDKMNNANKDRSAVDADRAVTEVISSKSQRIGQDQAEQSSRDQVRRYQEVKDLPPTDEQKKVANRICKCLSNNPLFKSLKNAKSSDDIAKKIGEDKEKEVKQLQDCYNKIMVPSIYKLGNDAGIFAMKTRVHLNKECLDGTDKFWINLGGYLGRKAKPAEVEINMLQMEAEKKGLIKRN